MVNTYIDVRKTKSSEHFYAKCALMNVDINTQIEILNKMYDGKLHFIVGKEPFSAKETAMLDWVHDDIRILELPEVDNFEIGFVNSHNGSYKPNNVGTLKLPKTMKSVRWNDLSQFHNLTSLWIWDTTELIGEKSYFSSIKMLIVQSSTGGKTKVYRF